MQTFPEKVYEQYEVVAPRATVRESDSLKSPILAFLTTGIVVDTTGRRINNRVEISHPVNGWVSEFNQQQYACIWPLNGDWQEGIIPKLRHMDNTGLSRVRQGTMVDYATSKSHIIEDCVEYNKQLMNYFTDGCEVEICDSRRKKWIPARFHSFENTHLIAGIRQSENSPSVLYSCSLSTIRRPVSPAVKPILNELKLTEEEYIKNLENMDEMFFKGCDLPGMASLRAKLGVVKNLIKGHKRFLIDMQEAQFTIYSLCQIFEDKAGFFQYYHQYFEVFSEIMEEFDDLTKRDRKVKSYFDAKGESFESCALRPVKRPHSYQEFLKKLRKKTDHSFEQYLLSQALEKFKRLLYQLNEKKRMMENKVKTQRTIGRIHGFVGDLLDGGQREFLDEFVCQIKHSVRTVLHNLYFTSDSIIITDSKFKLKHFILYKLLDAADRVEENGIELTYTIYSKKYMTLREKVQNHNARVVRIHGDTDGTWYTMIQRQWHGIFDSSPQDYESDKRLGLNKSISSFAITQSRSISVDKDDSFRMHVKFDESDMISTQEGDLASTPKYLSQQRSRPILLEDSVSDLVQPNFHYRISSTPLN